MSSCFRCPFTREKRCDGSCGLCPPGKCAGDTPIPQPVQEERHGVNRYIQFVCACCKTVQTFEGRKRYKVIGRDAMDRPKYSWQCKACHAKENQDVPSN